MLYYYIILYYVIILYRFCFKGEIEKYWRGLSRPKSRDPPRRISGMLCRARPDRRQGTDARFYCEARRSPTRRESGLGLTLTLPTPTKSIVGSSGAL